MRPKKSEPTLTKKFVFMKWINYLFLIQGQSRPKSLTLKFNLKVKISQQTISYNIMLKNCKNFIRSIPNFD